MRKAISLCPIVLVLVFAGCGSSDLRVFVDPPVVTIALHASATTVEAGSTVAFSATLTNAANQAVIWHVNGMAGGHPTCGVITEGMYTAPANVTAPMQVTITAVAQVNPDVKASATLTVTPVQTLTIEPANAIIEAGGTQKFTLKMSDGTTPTGTWISYGATISADGVVTAPLGIGTLGLQVASNTTPSKTAYATARVVGSNAMVNGQYTFVYDGMRSGEHIAMAGTFIANGEGAITGGVLDAVSPSGVERDVRFTGSYRVGHDGRGVMTIDTPSGQRAWRFVVAAASEIVFAELGSTSSGTGLMQLPGASTAVAGGVYLFGSAPGSKGPAMAGMFEPNTANLTGEYDLRRMGKPAVHTTFIGTGDVLGGTRTMISLADNLGTHEFRVYSISPANLYAISLDPAIDVLLKIDQQMKTPFDAGEFTLLKTLIGGGTAATGTIAFVARDISLRDGKVQSGTLDEHRAKSFQTLTATGGSYAPGPGRMEFKFVTSAGTRSFIAYVANTSGTVVLDEEDTQVAGTLEVQPIEIFNLWGTACYERSMFSAASPGAEQDIVLGLLTPAAELEGGNIVDALLGGTVLLDQVVTAKTDLLSEGSSGRRLKLTGGVSRDYVVQGCRAISTDPLTPELGRLWGFPQLTYPDGFLGWPWMGPIGGW